MTKISSQTIAPAEPVIRIGIVEDDNRIRTSLVDLVDSVTGFRCISANPSAEAALACPWIGQADLVLMDINLPGRSGIECVRELKGRHPKLQIMMLTVYEDTDRIFESLKSGATGYLLKRTPPEELIEAMRDLQQGGSPMSSRIARKVVTAFRDSAGAASASSANQPAPSATEAALTQREHSILESLAQGFLYKEIAEEQGISVNTVRTHLRSIYEKLHVHNRTEAVLRFLGR